MYIMKKIYILILFSVLLTACGKNNLNITKQDVLEVCVDVTGHLVEEVKDASVVQEDGYKVTFSYDGNNYIFKVGENGIIQDRNVEIDLKNDEDVQPVEEENHRLAIQNSMDAFYIDEESIVDQSIEQGEDGNMTIVFTLSDGRKLVSITDSTGTLIDTFSE